MLNWSAGDMIIVVFPYFLRYWVAQGNLLATVKIFGFDIAIEKIGNVSAVQNIIDRIFDLVNFFGIFPCSVVISITADQSLTPKEMGCKDQDQPNKELVHGQGFASKVKITKWCVNQSFPYPIIDTSEWPSRPPFPTPLFPRNSIIPENT